ncbi:MAG TPA: MBL fold metallo-hydrolase [Steroidobacteraceae bacterium]|nr:MBL fold metallo-hydrolase [Steroidobacteraceae bacterium]
MLAVVPPAHASAAEPLEVIVLGSGGPGATGRASASYAVLIDGTPRILVDAGSGAFVRIGESKVDLDALDVVLLTHLHVDHAAELPGIMKARAVSSSGPIVFKIYGPAGSPGSRDGAYFPSTRRFLDLLFGSRGAFAYLRDFAAPITIEPHDLPPTARSMSFGSFTVSSVAGHHGDAPAVIYRVNHDGKSVTFSGDIDAAGLPALRRIADRTDLLIFDAPVLDPPDSPAVLYTLHSPPQAIGQVARAAGARALLLSHLSPATDAGRDPVLRSIRQNYAGPVSFATDGMRVHP